MSKLPDLRPYTDAELAAIRRNYSMGAVIDNERLAEAGYPYRVRFDGSARCVRCGGNWKPSHRCTGSETDGYIGGEPNTESGAWR